ncbi:hypothetical protein [Lactobacillus sp. PV012]|uniref:hypothetical protein n=1 Tax=Lactobacillus sp. PV012 TaxID=2594494 RepID=UPI00223F5542|nr:hypothetical protein [Lactobacillus sp. PV012]QNQ82286.1 hypothetical protein FP433_04170 [Lactobacillus sp. PV012]
MKNRKRFQKFMLSAVALTTLISFTSSAGIAQATWDSSKPYKGELNVQRPIKNAYGVAKIKKYNNKKNPAISPYIGIEQGSKNGNNMANYVNSHDTTGFLVENKGLSGQPFGGKKAKWHISNEADPKRIKKGKKHEWYVYHLPKNDPENGDGVSGKLGMYYKNALTYYPNEKGKNQTQGSKVPLDARIVWNGDYHYDNKGKMGNPNIHFDTEHLAVKEPYDGEGNFSLILTYAKGKKKGQPFKKIKSELSQTDIDSQQGILFNIPSYIIVNKSTKLNAGVETGYGINSGIQNGLARIFGDEHRILRDKKTGKNLRQGTVWPDDPDGRFSYIPKNPTSEYNVTFVHGYNNQTYLSQWHKYARPSASFKVLTGKFAHDANNIDSKSNYEDASQADYFGFDFDKGMTTSYDIPVDKWVSKTNNFTKHSTKETINDTGTAYFDIHTSLKAPSSALVKSGNTKDNYNALPIAAALKDKDDPLISHVKAKHAKQQLVLKDYIDPSLEVVSAKVYESDWGDKYGKKLKTSNAFKMVSSDKGTPAINNKKGYTLVEAKITDKAAEATSDAWHKNYHLIIEVKPKPDQQPTEGSIYNGSTIVNNTATLNESKTTKTTKLKVTYKHTDTTTKGDSKNGLTAHKFVYEADPKDPTKVKDTGAADIHEQTVYPNQYLYYRLHFKINDFTQVEKKDGHKLTSSDGQKLVDDKYTDFTIHDTLDDKFRTKLDSSGDAAVDHVQVSLDPKDFESNSATHGATINGNKLSIKINKDSGKDKDKTMLKELSKNGGVIWVQYRVQIRPNEVGENANKYLKPLNLHYEDNGKRDEAHTIQNEANIDGHWLHKTREETESADYQEWEATYDYWYNEWQKAPNSAAKKKIKENHSEYLSGSNPYSRTTVSDTWTTSNKSIAGESDLIKKRETNKVKNYLMVPHNGGGKVVNSSYEDSGNVVNDQDKVWEVVSNLASNKQQGKPLTQVRLKDKVESSEILDASKTWTSENDGHVPDGTYTGIRVFRNGKDVTSNFHIQTSSKSVIADANKAYLDKLPDDEENNFILAVPGTIHHSYSYKAGWDGASDKAYVETSVENTPSNNVVSDEATWEGKPVEEDQIPSAVSKSITSIKDLTTGKDVDPGNSKGDSNPPLNPNHDYEIGYRIDAQLGTDRDLRNLKISDPLPENTTLEKGSVKLPSGWSSASSDTDFNASYNGNATK